MATLYQEFSKFTGSDLIALRYENKEISYNKMDENVRRMITFLNNKGIKKGDIITVVLPNIPATIYLFYALDAIGAVQNIIHPLTPLNGIFKIMKKVKSTKVVMLETIYQDNQEIIKNSDYQFFFLNPMYDNSLLMRKAFYLKYKKAKEKNNIIRLDDFRKNEPCIKIESRNDSEDSIYLHSGGTTSEPKTIVLSDVAFNNLSKKVSSIMDGTDLRGKSMLAVLPCFHGFGLGMGIHSALSNGGISAIMMKFSADKVIKWIDNGKINYIIGIPLLYKKLLENENLSKIDLSHLEYCFIGGDNVDENLIVEFNNFMKKHNSCAKLLEGYGLTEMVTVCSVNTKSHNKTGSVGKPLEGIEISIRDDSLNVLNSNEIGEVYVHGDTIMNGYLNDEKATKGTLKLIDEKVWVRTQDLGYIDEDGYLFLKGRKKRLIIINGVNVYPLELEKSVLSLTEIKMCALVAFENPSMHMVLFVIKNKQCNIGNEQIKDKIIEKISKEFFKYYMPSKIVFLDKFPLTEVGKIDYKGFIDPQ